MSDDIKKDSGEAPAKEQSLKSKTSKGLSWSFIDNILSQGVTFIVGIVLANLLTPDEYGLIGIISIFIVVCQSITDSGFGNALVRKTNAKDIDYNTVFITNMALSVFLAIVMFFCAPLIAHFFKQPKLTALTQAMSSILIINALSLVQTTILIKRIDFKAQTKISFISSTSSGAVGIFMAFKGFGVWSLVGQQISRQTLSTILLWVYNKWIPRLEFSKASFHELFGFGWKLMVSSLISTVWNEIYQVVIGKVYTPVTLGLYTRASLFANVFSSNITSVVQRVTYPALSAIKDDVPRLREAYRRVIKSTMLVTFSCMLVLAAISKPMILCLIGEKWLGAVTLLQIICFQRMLYPLHALNLNMLQVQGRSDLFLRLEIIKKIIMIGPILLGIFVSIYWMLIGGVITGFISYYLNAYYSGPFIGYSLRMQIVDILPSFMIAMVVAGCVYAISFMPINIYAVLSLQLIVAGILLIAILEKIKHKEYLEIKDMLLRAAKLRK